MKKLFFIIVSISLFMSCNMNPSKEERIQKLEQEIQLVTVKISDIENFNKNLILQIKQLEERIDTPEQR